MFTTVSQNDYGRKADASCWGVPAPNPAGNEYGKLEVVIVNHFLIFQSMDSALNLLSQHLME